MFLNNMLFFCYWIGGFTHYRVLKGFIEHYSYNLHLNWSISKWQKFQKNWLIMSDTESVKSTMLNCKENLMSEFNCPLQEHFYWFESLTTVNIGVSIRLCFGQWLVLKHFVCTITKIIKEYWFFQEV